MTHSVGSPLDDDPDGLKGAYTGNLIPLDTEDCEPINFMPRMTGFPVSITLRQ